MNWNRSVIGAVIALPMIGLLAWGMTTDPNLLPSTLPGRPAPAFALRIMDSESADTVRLADHAGDVVVVNFWASWCLACRTEHSDLSRAAEKYAQRGVSFYGILYNDSEANARAWIREMGGQSYPTLVDNGSRAAIDYGLLAVPETFIIDQQGIVVHKQLGAITLDELSAIIDPLIVRANANADAPAPQAGR